MKDLVFKTNIKCQNCLNTVTPYLNKVEGLEKWQVDLQHADRLLHAQGTAPAKTIVQAIEAAGFTAKAQKNGLLQKLFN